MASGAGRAQPVRSRKPHRIFDRPRQPRDWRWVVGGIGQILIVTGLLMFAFVAYQLWGTGIYTAQAQNRLDDEFANLAVPATAQATPLTTATAATAGTLAPATAPTAVNPGQPTADPAATSPGTAPADPDPTAPPPTAEPPPDTAPAETTAAPDAGVPYPFAAPAEGDALIKVDIPRIGVSYIVVEGVGLGDLAKGPGHFPESVLPGQLGNSAIAGHRTTHGAPFSDVDKLKPGDEIVITYPSIGATSPRFTYRVTGTEIVSPSDYGTVIPTTDPTRATLVLASCHPKRTSTQRIIIFADLADSSSSPVFAPTPLPAAKPDATIPGDNEPGDSASTTPARAGDTVSGTTPVAGQEGPFAGGRPDAGTEGGVGAAVAAAPASSVDAFSGGWFDDRAAWPHIILWGIALAAIAIGGYLLARRFRRIWLGTLVSIVPFVVVLYFWFENVNRMLPPGL